MLVAKDISDMRSARTDRDAIFVAYHTRLTGAFRRNKSHIHGDY